MILRIANPDDRSELARLRHALWPDCSEGMHAHEMASYFADTTQKIIFVLVLTDGSLAGFAEFSIRARVDGSLSERVAYLEGWFVEADLRGLGWGRRLVEAGENWAQAQGLTELASDAELENVSGQCAHTALGFRETFRQVHYLKDLS